MLSKRCSYFARWHFVGRRLNGLVSGIWMDAGEGGGGGVSFRAYQY